jgi:hypothetical protein
MAGVHDCGALNAVWRKCGKPTCAARPVTAVTAAPAPEHEKGLRAGLAETVVADVGGLAGLAASMLGQGAALGVLGRTPR